MKPRLVLIHSPLVGCGTWEQVAQDLMSDGHTVSVPDLTDTIAAGPPYHLRQAQTIADSAGDQPAVLVGHSGAGPLLATAGAMLPGLVKGYIFVDAGLPTPGRSWMETVPLEVAAQLRAMVDPRGWLPPWSQWWGEEELAGLLPDPLVRQRFAAGCCPLPLAMFEEIHPPAPGWPNAPGGYLQLSEEYEDDAARAAELGWPVRQLPSHHLAMLTEPGRVTHQLRRLADGTDTGWGDGLQT